uniref:Alpha-macroglobulin receptor-binding domain-containing protein n=1 Tax=Otus sunia TaxID=257818 RepID=A0A8C8ARZ4_9STRI
MNSPAPCFAPVRVWHVSLLSTQGKLVQSTLRCLQQVVHNITNIYTEAVLAYAFALAGDYETTQELLYKLEEQAIKSGGQIHWSPKPSSLASTDIWPDTQSVDIELTAYVLLAYLSKPRVHAGDMTTAAGIVAWLTRQQNAYGGFASTQDTVVALQALAKYAARTFSPSGQALVRVKSQRGFGKAFQVNRQKRLLVQQVASLLAVPGIYTVQATGSGCVYVQVSVYKEQNCQILSLTIQVCYVGARGTSNMALVEVEMLSGFIPVRSSLEEVRHFPLTLPEEMKIYFPEVLGETSLKLNISVEQDVEVQNLKAATVHVYDYYKPGEISLT